MNACGNFVIMKQQKFVYKKGKENSDEKEILEKSGSRYSYDGACL